MADINALQGMNSSIAAQRTASVQPQKTGYVNQDTASKSFEDIREQEAKKRSQLENVVAVSEYGDTVQVSDSGQKQFENQTADAIEAYEVAKYELNLPRPRPLEDFQINITPVMEEEKDTNAEDVDDTKLTDTDEKAADSSPTSYAGYTDMQLEQLYQKGEISRYEYETEIAEREEKKEERISDILGEDIFKGSREALETQRKMESVKQIFSDNASQKFDAQIRMDAIEMIEEENMKDQRILQQQTQQQSESIKLWVS